MTSFSASSLSLSKWMNAVGGTVLVLMMLLTVSDVILRIFGKPILGTYEMISLAGGIVIGFALPKASWDDAHVYVDILILGLSAKVKKVFMVSTKFLGIVLFSLLGWNMIMKGTELQGAGEVSLTLHIPFYPVAYALGFCFFIECLVLCSQIVMAIRGGGGHE